MMKLRTCNEPPTATERASQRSRHAASGSFRAKASEFAKAGRRACVVSIVGLVCSSRVASGAVPVDWLAFSAGADRTHFALLNDQGMAFAQAEINIASGTLPPFTPSAGSLGASFWVTSPDFVDSGLGDATIATTRVQVAPQAGSVQYQLVITGADLSGTYFSIGQLFGTPIAGTWQINILALTSLGQSVPVNFIGTHGWDDGIRLYTQPLIWDASLEALSLAPGADGESEFAFFRVPTTASAITKLLFDIPNGYNAGNGDALEFTFGVPVPEPDSTVLIALGSLLLGTWHLRCRSRRTESLAIYDTPARRRLNKASYHE